MTRCPYCGHPKRDDRLACGYCDDLPALDHAQGFASGQMDETGYPPPDTTTEHSEPEA